MAPRSPAISAPPPTRTLVAIATLASQLLGTLTFALALVWIAALAVHDARTLGIAMAGAACVFAGGIAHRGSIIALAICALFDLAIAVTMFARLPTAEAFLWAPLARISAADHTSLAMTLAGVVAAAAAITCIAALPQANRFAAWRVEQILHAARTIRG